MLVAVRQPGEGPEVRRIATDHTEVNKVTEEIKYPVRNQLEVAEKLTGAHVHHDPDARKGHNQVKVTERTKKLLAAVTPDGQYLPNMCLFWGHGLPLSFSICHG